MVKHIVMFKLIEKNSANLNKGIEALNSLKGNIETLKHIEIGTDFMGSERSYDIVLTTHFDNREELKTYASHKNHLPVINIMKSISSSIVVDYETK